MDRRHARHREVPRPARDPRFSLHTATVDTQVSDGDAKVWGTVEDVHDEELHARFADDLFADTGLDLRGQQFDHLFAAHLVGAAAVEVGGGHMDVTVWRDGAPESRRPQALIRRDYPTSWPRRRDRKARSAALSVAAIAASYAARASAAAAEPAQQVGAGGVPGVVAGQAEPVHLGQRRPRARRARRPRPPGSGRRPAPGRRRTSWS